MKIGKVMGCALVGACVVVGGVVVGGGAIAQELDEATFALPQEVVSSATAFEHYMTSAARIDSGFSSGASVARSVDAAASYQPAQLEEGMIAYGAIAALQDDRFVAGVEQAGGRGEDRAAFAERLIEDPYAATRVDGAEGAAERVEAALAAKARPLMSAATLVNRSAYTVQHQAWSKVMVANAQGRLAQVKSLSAQRAAPSDDESQAMMQALAGADPRDAAGEAPAGFTAIEARSLALAAESVLGRAGGAERDRLAPLLTEADSAQCLKMAKLNLYQCMAVAGPQYEDIFCMGQHAMLDTGQCVSHAAHDVGQSTAVASLSPRAQASAIPLAAHRSLRIDP
ncbi:MAG TPA: hypothetical protein VGG29_16615 [Caulobacteraceae bacterium]|jgi:hypothetical protein